MAARNNGSGLIGLHRRLAYQEAGEGEVYIFGMVLIGCLLVSGFVALMRWIKATKDARTYGGRAKVAEPIRREMPGHQVLYLPAVCGKNPCVAEFRERQSR